MKPPKHLILFLFFCQILPGCKEHVFTQQSGGMANTINPGEKFVVTTTDTFKKNDIIAFNYYGPDYPGGQDENGQFTLHWEKRINRLIAFSGEVVEIKQGEVFVNERHIPRPGFAKGEYEIRSKVEIDDLTQYDENAHIERRNNDTLVYLAQLTSDLAADYRKRTPAVISVEKWISPFYSENDTILARSSAKDIWSADNYGPLRIPKPGQTIMVDAGNYKLFKNIPGIQPGQFVIKEKLYFVLGDNWHGSEDSRYIGFISQSKIFGVVKIK